MGFRRWLFRSCFTSGLATVTGSCGGPPAPGSSEQATSSSERKSEGARRKRLGMTFDLFCSGGSVPRSWEGGGRRAKPRCDLTCLSHQNTEERAVGEESVTKCTTRWAAD